MSNIALIGATKDYGPVRAVDRMDLEVAEGELVALLGGSGCGKTTTLRLIAGFAELSAGDILIGGRSVKDIPAHKRNIGVVFQNYALFPHLTARENIAFGLYYRKLGRAEMADRVAAIIRMVKLEGLENRLPPELSGGQQQRVALARALVIEPTVLLLDEPLSNLDAKLRLEMQAEIRRIQAEVGITTILVTHDQGEAISLADRIAVMRNGVIQQVGEPKLVFQRPVNKFVADFMGFTNFVEGRVQDMSAGACSVRAGDLELRVPADSGRAFRPGQVVTLAIRPENMGLSRAGSGDSADLPAVVRSVTYKGVATRIEACAFGGAGGFPAGGPESGAVFCVDAEDDMGLRPGEQVHLRMQADKVILLEN
jgi:ABC-type Fe3+/spermidine/putrescine transport system ATPase subunit